MAPVLFADRFCVWRSRAVLDLATGEPAWIRPVTLADDQARNAWLVRSAELLEFSSPTTASLLDFGAAGRAGYFDAWSGPPPTAPPQAGVECRDPRVRPTWACEQRNLIDRLSEVLDTGVGGRPRAVSLAVSAPISRRTVVSVIARASRLRGYVPVSARMLIRAATPGAGSWRGSIVGRHVLVLCVTGEGLESHGSMLFLSLGLASDRPHVLLTLSAPPARTGAMRSGASRPAGVREESAPYAADAVIAPWTPSPAPSTLYQDERAHAILSAASIGRHASADRGLRELAGRCARRHEDAGAGDAELALGRLLLVRGQPDEALRAFARAHQHFELARLVSRTVTAGVFMGLAHTDGGRFREAESAFRASGVAALTVGDDRARRFAAQGLARCLIWQDRHEEAIECLCGVTGPPVIVGRPGDDEATSEWRRLGAAAGVRGGATASVALREPAGLFADFWTVGAIDPNVAQTCLVARATIGVADLAAAGRATSQARSHALISGRPADLAAACRVRAQLFAAMGDLAATREQVAEGLEAARRAHQPLRALRLRLVLATALLADGRAGEAKAVLARLARIEAARLPAVVRLPLEQLARGEPAASAVLAHAGRPAARRASVADGLIEVMGVCQSADDECDVLRKVAGILRARARAISVVCLASDPDRASVVVSDGAGQPADAVALRAIESGLAIPPSSSRTGLEAAVPIRYASQIVGALACRWSADVVPDWTQTGVLLAAASAAVAPCVRAVLDRRAAPAPEPAAGAIIGVSEAIRALCAETARAAGAPFNVVIEGESGSGKELVARAIHRLGPRGHRPFCALNCAALTDELVEAELFGHTRGAFTGAVTERKGLFEEAHQGTMFLDEVGELTPRAQAKLLRVIQEGEVRRVGENLPRRIDVRIVAATNRSLRAAVEAGGFRPDLRYRLEVIRLAVPPLRARVEDIPVLAAHFWKEAVARVGSRSTLAPATIAALAHYDWPGNVRELQNVMAALAVSAGRRGSMGPERLPAIIGRQAAEQPDTRNLDDARRRFESAYVRAALARAGGRRAQAAADLGLTRQGLAKLMTRLGID